MSAIAELLGKLLDLASALPRLRRDQKRKETLRHLLEESELEWRSIATLARSAGASEKKTRQLLVSIGARASVGSGPEVWGLKRRVGVSGTQRGRRTTEG